MIKNNSWILAGLCALMVSACSTAGGKQESVIGNHSVGRDLKGSVAEVKSRVDSSFKDLGIAQTDSSVKNSGNERSVDGKTGSRTVSVDISDLGNGMSHVEVTAKDGQLQWNQDYAQSVLSKIIARS